MSRLVVVLLAAGLVLALALTGLLLYWGAQNPAQVSEPLLRRPEGGGDGYLDFPGFPAAHGGCRRADARGGVGLLATLTCVFSILWLWVVGRGHAMMADPVAAS